MVKVNECRCALCKTFCQGFESIFGIICADCYKKELGKWPWED